jgi:hypothetical protein
MTRRKNGANGAAKKPNGSAKSSRIMRPFSRSLPMQLMRAREAVMRRFRPHLASHGFSEQQWRVLRALADAGELEIGALAAECHHPEGPRHLPLGRAGIGGDLRRHGARDRRGEAPRPLSAARRGDRDAARPLAVMAGLASAFYILARMRWEAWLQRNPALTIGVVFALMSSRMNRGVRSGGRAAGFYSFPERGTGAWQDGSPGRDCPTRSC